MPSGRRWRGWRGPTSRKGNRRIKAGRVVSPVAVGPTVDMEIDGLTHVTVVVTLKLKPVVLRFAMACCQSTVVPLQIETRDYSFPPPFTSRSLAFPVIWIVPAAGATQRRTASAPFPG